jgi:uncharacterized peroxidase-related enzyme
MERLVPIPFKVGLTPAPASLEAGSARVPRDCNFFHLLANSPAATEAFLACEKALAKGRLTPMQRELIALAVAEINGSKYGLSAHYAAAKEVGLSDEEIHLARQATSHDPKLAAMLRFTRAVTLQRGDISDADFQPLRRVGFTDVEIPEIVANIAQNVFANYFNNVVRSVVDFPLLQPGSDVPVVPRYSHVPKELSI